MTIKIHTNNSKNNPGTHISCDIESYVNIFVLLCLQVFKTCFRVGSLHHRVILLELHVFPKKARLRKKELQENNMSKPKIYKKREYLGDFSKTCDSNEKKDSLHSKRHNIYIKKGAFEMEKNINDTKIVSNDNGGKEAENTEKKYKEKTSKRRNHNEKYQLKNLCREIKQERVEEKKKSLYDFLKKYEDGGARLSIGGRKFSAERISEIMSVAENALYMPDIKINDKGIVTNINYDRITEK